MEYTTAEEAWDIYGWLLAWKVLKGFSVAMKVQQWIYQKGQCVADQPSIYMVIPFNSRSSVCTEQSLPEVEQSASMAFQNILLIILFMLSHNSVNFELSFELPYFLCRNPSIMLKGKMFMQPIVPVKKIKCTAHQLKRELLHRYFLTIEFSRITQSWQCCQLCTTWQMFGNYIGNSYTFSEIIEIS